MCKSTTRTNRGILRLQPGAAIDEQSAHAVAAALPGSCTRGISSTAAGFSPRTSFGRLLRVMGNTTSVAVSVGVPLALGQLMGLVSAPDILGPRAWYPKLAKPKWTIPTPLFGPTWALLYTAQGYAAHRVYQRGGGALPLGLYAAQLVLNLAWQPLFFRAKSFAWAKRDILALLGVLSATIYQFGKVDKTAAQLMLPYLGFSAYATALTYAIAGMNTGAGNDGKSA